MNSDITVEARLQWKVLLK